jgi:hypothetical protein
MDDLFSRLAREVSEITTKKLGEIQKVAQETKILAINARIEAARAGDAGRTFATVTDEVKSIATRVQTVADELDLGLSSRVSQLEAVSTGIRGSRLADLALNMIDIMDRNLYERSCDVRWWATDSAVVAACANPDADSLSYASSRLGVILDSYTVYLDLWIADLSGTVIASARPGRYPDVIGSSVAGTQWFTQALATKDGTEYAVADVEQVPRLGNSRVATYATAVRADGRADGAVIGALGIFFDWTPQAQGVVDSVRLTDEERPFTRCLLIDKDGRVLAASDDQGVLSETISLNVQGPQGYLDLGHGELLGYALTPGYETYPGLGWYGVIQQR